VGADYYTPAAGEFAHQHTFYSESEIKEISELQAQAAAAVARAREREIEREEKRAAKQLPSLLRRTWPGVGKVGKAPGTRRYQSGKSGNETTGRAVRVTNSGAWYDMDDKGVKGDANMEQDKQGNGLFCPVGRSLLPCRQVSFAI